MCIGDLKNRFQFIFINLNKYYISIHISLLYEEIVFFIVLVELGQATAIMFCISTDN